MIQPTRLLRPRWAFGLTTMLLSLTIFAGAAVASTPGVTGRVIDATTHRPVAGQRVTLSTYRGEIWLSNTTAVTDTRGTFAFDAPTSNTTGYQLTTEYKRGTYRTSLIKVGDAMPPVSLRVYEPTSDPAAIAQTSWVVWLDAMPAGVVVQQDLTWKNDGTTAYVGPGTGGGGVTEVPLGAGARDVQFRGIYLNGGGRIEGATYEGTQPIVPGTSTATVRFVVASLTRLNLVSPLATRNLHVFVAQGYTASAPGMTPGGQITDRGTTYQVFTAANVASHRTIGVSLTPTSRPRSDAMPFAIAGVLILLLVAGVSIRQVIRRRRRPKRRVTQPVAPHEMPRSGRGRSWPSHTTSGTDEAEILLQEIAAIDIAFEEGLLEPAAYERVRAAAKERLAEAAQDDQLS